MKQIQHDAFKINDRRKKRSLNYFTSHFLILTKYCLGATFGNQASYQWAGYTDFDFAADEEGFWLIHSTYENTLDIVITKLDPNTLDVLDSFRTNWRKQWSANAFMACGVS